VNNALEAVGQAHLADPRIRIKLDRTLGSWGFSVFSPTHLPAEVRDRLFEVPQTISSKKTGWGLGLCIARVLTERADGRLEVFEDDAGVCFSCVWPLPHEEQRLA
jgi:C4-dicarboxylate-specific signal transduction histidine kinase